MTDETPKSYSTLKSDDIQRLHEWWSLPYLDLAGAVYASISQRDANRDVLQNVLLARAADESRQVARWTMFLALATAGLAVAAVVSLFIG